MTAPDVVEGILSGLWWAIALRAAAAILLGVIAIFMPGPTLAAIVKPEISGTSNALSPPPACSKLNTTLPPCFSID